MTETALALLLAHMLADFPLQTPRMVASKTRPAVLLGHVVVHFVLVLAVTGGDLFLALAVASTHLVIDWIKIHVLPEALWSYLADQGAHLAVIAGLAVLMPGAVAWPLPPEAPGMAATLIGLIAATLAGGPAVGLLMKPYQDHAELEGLPNAGRLIGLLERGLIYLLLMTGQAGGIGFLIAAKSILRFDTASKDQKAGEYVIIGTLASFGWAIAISQLTIWTLGHIG